MKIRAASNDDDDGALDSLMDTMFNVVGILVLVLITTQLDVAEKVRDITEKSEITQADLDEKKAELEKLKANQKDLEQKATTVAMVDIDAERERLRRMQETIESRKALLKENEKKKNTFAMAIESDRKKAAESKKVVEAQEKQREALSQTLTELLKKKADLQAMLDTAPKRTGPPPSKLVALPNPRPAPDGARRLNFLCANNKLYPMNIDELRKDAELRSKAIITRHKLNLDPEKGIDPEAFAKYFLRLPDPKDEFLNVEYYIQDDRWPRMRLTANERRGFTDEELMKPTPKLRTVLSAINPTKNYVYFYVMPDSFDIYITARQLMMMGNVPAGWEPMPANWTYTTSVPVIELGPPRPPAPKPTTPAPPAKPANVLD